MASGLADPRYRDATGARITGIATMIQRVLVTGRAGRRARLASAEGSTRRKARISSMIIAGPSNGLKNAASIAILLLITNWFFHKNYWTGWIASFHARKRRLISGEAGLWRTVLERVRFPA